MLRCLELAAEVGFFWEIGKNKHVYSVLEWFYSVFIVLYSVFFFYSVFIVFLNCVFIVLYTFYGVFIVFYKGSSMVFQGFTGFC